VKVLAENQEKLLEELKTIGRKYPEDTIKVDGGLNISVNYQKVDSDRYDELTQDVARVAKIISGY
jgi:hypothetical protein